MRQLSLKTSEYFGFLGVPSIGRREYGEQAAATKDVERKKYRREK